MVKQHSLRGQNGQFVPVEKNCSGQIAVTIHQPLVDPDPGEISPGDRRDLISMTKAQRIEFYLNPNNKISAAMAKYIEEMLVATRRSRQERTPYSHYHEDISLFKVHYCGKELIPTQERLIVRIQEALKEAYNRGLYQVIILLLYPKRFGKTEGVIQPVLTHHIVHNKEDSCKYFGEAETLATQKISPIKEMMEDPRSKLSKDYGPFRTRSNWSKQSFSIQRNRASPDPTLEALGYKSQKMGKNSDIIFIDDPMSADMSFEVRRNVHNAIFGEILNTRNPMCPTIVIMTRKAPEDLATCLIESKCPFCDHSHNANVVIIDEFKQALSGDYKHPCGKIIQDPEGNILEREVLREEEDTYWLIIERNKEGRERVIDVIIKGEYHSISPERFKPKELIIMYWQIGELAFDRDYQNDPSAMGGNLFKTKWFTGQDHPFKCFIDYEFNFWDTHIIRGITCDLALSDSPTGDYTGILELAYDPWTAEFYIYKEHKLYKELDEVFLYLCERGEEFKPHFTLVEAVGMFKPLTKRWHVAAGNLLNIIYIEKKLTGKIERIAATLQPVFQTGREHLTRAHRHFIKEAKDFPYSQDDHLLDANQQFVEYILSGKRGGKVKVGVS